jgi:CRP-like cAMP-binding protein
MSSSIAPARSIGLKSRLFEGIPAGDVGAILDAAVQQRLAANTVVFQQGDPARSLYLLTEGRARHFYSTPDGRKMLLPWILPGEAFGVGALLPESTLYLVSAEAVTGGFLYQWDRAGIRALAGRHPRLLENVFAIAADLMHWAVDAHVGLLCHTAKERLAQVLMNLAQPIGKDGPEGIQLEITNEELADAANVTTFTASRIVSEWHRRGVLKKGRGKVLLRSPEKLFTQ